MIGEAPLASWWGDFVSGPLLTSRRYCELTRPTILQKNNVKGTFIPTQSFIQCFGGEGTIINLVSTAVALAVPRISSYASSKLAMIKFGMALTIGESKLLVIKMLCAD